MRAHSFLLITGGAKIAVFSVHIKAGYFVKGEGIILILTQVFF
jgi:hypothetical protein